MSRHPDTAGAGGGPALDTVLSRRPALVAGLSAALFAVLAWLHWRETGYVVMSGFFDLSVYRAGAQALLDGVPLYQGGLGPDGTWSFTYPPFAALVFLPLAVAPVAVAQALVLPAGVVLLAASVHLTLRHAGGPLATGGRRTAGGAGLVVAFTALLLWLEPVSWTLYLGQVNLLLMLLVLADLAGGRAGPGERDGRWRRRLRGVGVGVATGIKLTPALFIVHLLLTRRYREAATATGTAAATALIGLVAAPGDSLDYWGGTFLRSERLGEVASPMNQSMNGLLARATGIADPPLVLWLAVAVPTVMLGLGLAAMVHRRGLPLLGVLLCGLTTAAVSPVSWSHHWVWFAPLAVYAVVRLRPGARGRVALALGCTFLLVFAWPLHFLTGHRMDAPPLGLVALPPRYGLEVLYGNLYLLLFAAVLAATAAALRAAPARTAAGSHSGTKT